MKTLLYIHTSSMRTSLLAGILILVAGFTSSVFATVTAPSNFQVSYQGYTGSNLYTAFSWQDNSNNETGFQLLQSSNTGTAWKLVETLPANTTSTFVFSPASGSGVCRTTYYNIRSYRTFVWTSRMWFVSSMREYSPLSYAVPVVNNSGALCQ